jgi:anti-sigma factor RsiW
MMYAMSQEIPCHLDPEDLERYVRQEASEEEVARFEEHLLLCEPCREELANVESFVSAMRAAAAELRRGDQKERYWWSTPRWVPALAALAVLVLAAIVVPRFTGNSQPPLAISLAATRGAGMDAVAPAGRALALTPDLTGLPADTVYRLEIVDEQGNLTWRGRYSAGQDAAGVPAQRAGAHFVRVYSSSGVLLREYGLVVNR